jgi:hypothetical protein
MGLAERRATKAFQDNSFPKLKAAVDAAAGFVVELDVAWDSLAQDGYAHLYDEAWTKVYFAPLTRALEAVTVDDLGKTALKAGLKKIVIEDAGSSWPVFDGGVLTLKFPAVANLDDGESRANTIRECLERAL